MKGALRKVSSWANSVGLGVYPEKTELMMLTQLRHQLPKILNLNISESIKLPKKSSEFQAIWKACGSLLQTCGKFCFVDIASDSQTTVKALNFQIIKVCLIKSC